jgi:hypothetical protein
MTAFGQFADVNWFAKFVSNSRTIDRFAGIAMKGDA